MATTPLKTASRALSIATILVAGVAAWVLGTQGSTTADQAVTGRTIEFAAVAAKSPVGNPQDVTVKSPTRRRLEEDMTRPDPKPRSDGESFFDDERSEPQRQANSSKSSRSSPTKSPVRIPPDLGRLSGRERDAVAFDDLEELDLAAEDEVRQPRTRINKRSVVVFRPADVVLYPESARVDSQLTALQKKIDQLAQAQSEQKSNDVQKAIETLQRVQENKQAEQIEKLWQRLRESQPNATDPAKPQVPKAETPKPTATSEPVIDDKADDGKINDAGLPESRTTEVTPDVKIRDGSTIVVGGLIEEQVNQSQSRIPGLGALSVVGNLFKSKTNDTTRTEMIVLITPRVIGDPDAECEGGLSRSENECRHQNFRDKLSPINRHNLARLEYERAARYFEEGDVVRANRHVDEALRHNRNDNDALRLRDQITAAISDKNWFKKLRRKPPLEYHRVPSAPTSLPGEAIFEQEIPGSTSNDFVPPTVVPSGPSATPYESSSLMRSPDQRVTKTEK